MVEVVEEEEVAAYTPTPTGSEDDGGSCDPPSPPSGHSDSPSLESQAARGPGQVGGLGPFPASRQVKGMPRRGAPPPYL
uniref:Uncharacterized protein n=1 Tax=Oryza rufipogon TaxID=4529 RepID=A0A0E0RG96_ORYRU